MQPITKANIIVSKGSLEGIYPGLILAKGARMEGIEANVFFTFFGMEAILKGKNEHIKVATVIPDTSVAVAKVPACKVRCAAAVCVKI